MSYILDALRKSEQQRQRDAAPLLFATQIASDVEKRPAFLTYGLVAIILICAGILIGWWHPWQQDKAEVVKDSIVITQDEATQPQIAHVSQLPPSESEKIRKPELVVPIQKSKSMMHPESRLVSSKQDVTASAEAQQPKPQATTALPKVSEPLVYKAGATSVKEVMPPSTESNDANSSSEVAQERKIIAMTELPLAIQQEIPMMTISGYAYSSIPKERSVGINDRLLQEGEYLAPGLRLEQISADGLVFSYKKYLFRHSI